MKLNVFEMLDYGPIVAKNEELGLLVTVNGSYLNLWVLQELDSDGTTFQNTDCRNLSADNGLYGLEIVELMDRAEKWLKEISEEQEG